MSVEGSKPVAGSKPWMERQLEPLARVASTLPPAVLTWSGLAASLGAACLLYSGVDQERWLTAPAAALLLLRLLLGTLDNMVERLPSSEADRHMVLSELSDRLSDIAILLALALRQDVRVLLAVFAIICTLIVSHVGVLGKAAGEERVNVGVLSKPERLILLVVACLVYAMIGDRTIGGFSIFDAMLLLFIPLAAFTLLQRLDRIYDMIARKHRR